MEAVGLAFAIVGAIDICLKFGNELIESCRLYATAEQKLAEKALRVESCWHRTSVQLNVIRSTHHELDDSLLSLHVRIYEVLIAKLREANRKIGGLQKGLSQPKGNTQWAGDWKRFKFIRTRQYLDETIEGLELWQKMFDPSWFLILRMTSTSVDSELDACDQNVPIIRKTKAVKDSLKDKPTQDFRVFLPEGRLDACEEFAIPRSPTQSFREATGKCHIVDTIQCEPHVNRDIVTSDIRTLVAKLYFVDPNDSGILQCRGAVRRKHEDGTLTFQLVFRYPKGVTQQPNSLRSLLGLEARHSLSNRLAVAQQLSHSVSHVHALGFVHKHIRPETILSFREDATSIGPLFLTGFDKFRNADGRTWRKGVAAWERNLYQHPGRQGLYPEEDYQMQHDIYSLGVCLLEIGTWTSLVAFDRNSGEPVPSLELQECMGQANTSTPDQIKQYLVSLAENRLSQAMGDKYKKVVVNCLTCLDQDNVDFSDRAEFEDSDGILIGVKYIEKVQLELDGIRM